MPRYDFDSDPDHAELGQHREQIAALAESVAAVESHLFDLDRDVAAETTARELLAARVDALMTMIGGVAARLANLEVVINSHIEEVRDVHRKRS